MPARAAGVSSMGEITLTGPSSHDLQAEAAVLAAGLVLQVGGALGVQVVECGSSEVTMPDMRRLDQLLVVGLPTYSSRREHVAEQLEAVVHLRRFGHGRTAKRNPRLRADDNSRGADGDAQQNQRCLAHYPRTLCISDFDHHGPGSTAAPSLRNST